MGYGSWVKNHSLKHKKIVQKLIKKGLDKEQIIEYFDFDNMLKNELDFCLLYMQNKKCHDIASLNCYLCSCPNFRFKDEGVKKIDKNIQYSFCDIDSKDGKQAIYGTSIHQDCSNCSVPHHKAYVRKHFDYEWSKIMNKCIL